MSKVDRTDSEAIQLNTVSLRVQNIKLFYINCPAKHSFSGYKILNYFIKIVQLNTLSLVTKY